MTSSQRHGYRVLVESVFGSKILPFITDSEVVACVEGVLCKEYKHPLHPLKQNDIDALRKRFSIHSGKQMTFIEIALSQVEPSCPPVTQERIRQRVNKALRWLRHPARALKLRWMIQS